MKLKRVSFTSTTWDRPRNISALGGNQTSIYVGQFVHHTQRAETAKVSSLEFDGRSQQLLMRLVYASGPKEGQPFRRFTTNEAVQPGEECDVVGMFCDDRTIFYYDDEPAARPQEIGPVDVKLSDVIPAKDQAATLPQCSACGKDSGGKPLCHECYEKAKKPGQQQKGK